MKNLLDQLHNLHIQYEIQEHPAIFTMEEAHFLLENALGEIPKNIFLKTANGKSHYLIVMCHNKKVNFKALRQQLETKSLSFAPEKDLMELLGQTKGCVSPLGIINDTQHHIQIVLDNDLKYATMIGVHPNSNTATLWLTYENLLKFINYHNNPVFHIKL